MIVYEARTGHVLETPLRKPSAEEVAWVHLQRPEAIEVEQVLGETFRCHPLVVEDCIKLNQRPKMDRYQEHIFLTFFALTDKHLSTVEIGIVIGPNFVITVTKKPVPLLQALGEKLLKGEADMTDPGRLLHQLLDRCVDDYSVITDQVEDRIDRMERRLYANPYKPVAQEVFQLKRSFHQLRRIIVEERTILGSISHQSFPYMRQESDVYFIDIYDHISRVVDSLDLFRDSLSGLLELQMNMKSDRMNEIMKTLTVMSSIFLPLTFIVGLYGMNFKNIPELSWDWGYAYVWGVMLVTGGALWLFFKWKRWL